MSLVIDIKVVPSSGKQKFVLDKSSTLKCYLKNPPEGGKANEELIKLLSRALRIPKSEITILLGATSRKKRLRLDIDLSFEDLLSKLGVERQMSI